LTYSEAFCTISLVFPSWVLVLGPRSGRDEENEPGADPNFRYRSGGGGILSHLIKLQGGQQQGAGDQSRTGVGIRLPTTFAAFLGMILGQISHQTMSLGAGLFLVPLLLRNFREKASEFGDRLGRPQIEGDDLSAGRHHPDWATGGAVPLGTLRLLLLVLLLIFPRLVLIYPFNAWLAVALTRMWLTVSLWRICNVRRLMGISARQSTGCGAIAKSSISIRCGLRAGGSA
jgi:hypothetical protein